MKSFTLVKKLILVMSVTAGSLLCFSIKNYNAHSNVMNNTHLNNIVALTSNESGMDITTREGCMLFGGIWGMGTIAKSSGFESISCEISGEISIFGFTLKGSYKKGEKYVIPWVLYTCETSEMNCCLKQGLFSGSVQLA